MSNKTKIFINKVKASDKKGVKEAFDALFRDKFINKYNDKKLKRIKNIFGDN